jgi:peptide deformylase
MTTPPTGSVSNGLPPIVQAGNAVLRGRARDLTPEEARSPATHQLIQTMIATMRAAPGVGLAAPQIGVPLRVIVLEDRPELMSKLQPSEVAERQRTAFGPRVFINPVLTPIGTEKATFFEGCLSVHGYTALVERSLEVSVTALDEEGNPQIWHVRGWPARILQHETDHINGTLYIDRMKSRSFATSEQAKALYAGKPIAEILRMLGE